MGDCGTGAPVPPELNCGPDRDIFFKYQHAVPTTEQVCVDLCGLPIETYDPMLAVYGPYTGDPSLSCPTPPVLTPEEVCDDDFCSTPGFGAPGRVEFTAARNQWFLIRVGGCAGSFGTGEMSVNILVPGEICWEPLGKCCYVDADGVQCVESTFQGCTDNVGGIWTFGLDCPTTPENDCPPVGRCCYLQTGIPICVENFEAECTVLSGEWTAGLNCVDNPCPPLGRCCTFDPGTGAPVCLDATSEVVCTGLSGLWLEAGDCVADPCPLGQCCYDDGAGGLACENTSEAACVGFWGGAWDGGTNCTQPCPEIGRCCYTPAPSCIDTTQVDCLSNFPGGSWTSGLNCTSDPCPF